MGSPSDWTSTLNEAQAQEILAVVQRVKDSGIPLREHSARDCPMPSLSKNIREWSEHIRSGRGFAVIRGVPVERLSPTDCEIFFWCLGLHLGTPGAQTSKGDLLTHVLDEGKKNEDHSRLYKTSSEITYHCDAADIVGLLCIQNSSTGGRSRIVSSVSVFNEFLKRYPNDVETLFDRMYLDARGENGLDYFPLQPLRFDGKRLRTFYHSDYFRSAKRHARIASDVLSYLPVLDRYESVALDPSLYLEMDLRPGDIQLLSNHTMLHARTAYTDRPDGNGKRHLLRLWISVDEREPALTSLLRKYAQLSLLRNLVAAKLRKRSLHTQKGEPART